jgi:hypothetical protein
MGSILGAWKVELVSVFRERIARVE